MPANMKIFRHLGSMGIQAWLLTVALSVRLSPFIRLADARPIPAMDTLRTLLPTPSLCPVHFPANLQPRPTPSSLYTELLRAFDQRSLRELIDLRLADTQKHQREKKRRHAKVISKSVNFSLGLFYTEESPFAIKTSRRSFLSIFDAVNTNYWHRHETSIKTTSMLLSLFSLCVSAIDTVSSNQHLRGEWMRNRCSCIISI